MKNVTISRRKKKQSKNNQVVVYQGKGAYNTQTYGSTLSGNNISLFNAAWGGSGEYSLRQNSLYKSGRQVPFMHSANESVMIRHREYICDISASAAFTVQKAIDVNPGLSSSFPFLAAIANNFQEYRFRGLIYEFKSTSATSLVSGTNTAMGSIMMAAQYRADASQFTSKLELLNEMWSVDSVPSQNCILPIECDPRENPMGIQYIRTSTVTAVTDKKFYDLASVTVASVGSQATNVVGELWASYEVELFKPTLASSTGPLAGNAVHFGGGVCTAAAVYGVQFFQRGHGVDFVINSAAGTLTINGHSGQRYFVAICYRSATSADVAQVSLVGGTRIGNWNLDTEDSEEAGAITITNTLSQFIEATASAIVLTTTLAQVGTTNVDVHVIQVEDSYR